MRGGVDFHLQSPELLALTSPCPENLQKNNHSNPIELNDKYGILKRNRDIDIDILSNKAKQARPDKITNP